MLLLLRVLRANIHLSSPFLLYPFSKFMIVLVEVLNLFFFWHYNVAPGARTQPSEPPGWPWFACSRGKPRWITYVHYLKGEACWFLNRYNTLALEMLPQLRWSTAHSNCSALGGQLKCLIVHLMVYSTPCKSSYKFSVFNIVVWSKCFIFIFFSYFCSWLHT